MDWVIHNYDVATSDSPDVETELRRLQCLKTYHMLDQDFQPCYQRIASLAARMCDAPAALITLVDLGREWQIAASFTDTAVVPRSSSSSSQSSLSSTVSACDGNKAFVLPRETPRQQSFGAHVILSRLQVFVVSDTTVDDRFHNNPFVLGGPHVRFYAAVPLRSPEGFRLGSISVLCHKERPEGLSMDQVLTLQDLAATTMELLERQRLILQTGTPTAPVASLEVQRSVTFLKKHLSSLHQDLQLSHVMNDTQKHILRSACDSAQYLYGTLMPLFETQSSPTAGAPASHSNTAKSDAAVSAMSSRADGVHEHSSSSSLSSNKHARNNSYTSPGGGDRSAGMTRDNDSVANVGKVTTVDLSQFVKNVEFAMDAFPKDVHVVLTVEPTLPERICFNDLKVFRSVLALLTSACERTHKGFVRLKIFSRERTMCDKELVFECEDTGPDVQLEQYHQIFEAPANGAETDNFMTDSASVAVCSVDTGGSCVRDSVAAAGSAEKANDDCITYNSETGKILLKPCFQPGLSEGLAVHAVAKYIGSLGGDYGFRPRDPESDEECDSTNEEEMDGDDCTGSIFWFSIPLREPGTGVSFSGQQRREKRSFDAVASKNIKSEYTTRSSHFTASCLE